MKKSKANLDDFMDPMNPKDQDPKPNVATDPEDNTSPNQRIQSKKIYTDIDVLTACIRRFEIIFENFDNVCFAVSGGKDSGVSVQIGNMVAERLHKKFFIMYIDLEAMYQETERFVLAIREKTKPNCQRCFWICLPMCEDNATSALNPEFITWDPSAREKWVRQIPPDIDAITMDNNPFPFYENLMDFNDFIDGFTLWLHEEQKATRTAMVVGIRTDESIRRYLAVAKEK
jgi:predicted phosphoadenosine phosphosulfate sulfurtransferase